MDAVEKLLRSIEQEYGLADRACRCAYLSDELPDKLVEKARNIFPTSLRPADGYILPDGNFLDLTPCFWGSGRRENCKAPDDLYGHSAIAAAYDNWKSIEEREVVDFLQKTGCIRSFVDNYSAAFEAVAGRKPTPEQVDAMKRATAQVGRKNPSASMSMDLSALPREPEWSVAATTIGFYIGSAEPLSVDKAIETFDKAGLLEETPATRKARDAENMLPPRSGKKVVCMCYHKGVKTVEEVGNWLR